MRKAEEEAIRRARREIVRVRGVEENGVLGDLLGGAVEEQRPVSKSVMDENEDEGMLVDED
jgi:ribonuclease P/MRP protein subunit POP5